MFSKQITEKLVSYGHTKAIINLNVDNTACVLVVNGFDEGEHTFTDSLTSEETKQSVDDIATMIDTRIKIDFSCSKQDKVIENLINSGHLCASISRSRNNDDSVLVTVKNGLGAHKGKTYELTLSKLETCRTVEEITNLILGKVNNWFYGWAARKGYRIIK
jgi:hypothetical protein